MFIQRSVYLFSNDFDCSGIEMNPAISATPQSFIIVENQKRKMATCGLKQEAVLLRQILEKRAKFLIVHASAK